MSIHQPSYPCPSCGAPATLATGCSTCGRPPNPDAAEVIRLDGEISALEIQIGQAQRAYLALTDQLRQARIRRNHLAARVRAAAPVAPPAGPVPSTARPEASTRTIQNLLFILGGLLLGTAAIVFTAVAWATFGVAGRAAILAVVTALTLAAPLLAVRRQLTATAETFAAVGLLLVLLDGYAARSVNLFGFGAWPAARYGALVAALGAVVAVGYGAASRLAAPRFAALLAAQPVLPLLAADLAPDSFGWALVFAAVAGLNLLTAWRLPAGPGVAFALRIVAWSTYGGMLVVVGVCGLVALAVADEVTGPVSVVGLPLVTGALLFVAGAMLARNPPLRAISGSVSVLAVAVAAVRPISVLWPSYLLIGGAVVTALIAGAVEAGVRLLPKRVRVGPWIGGLVTVTVPANVAGLMAIVVASATALGSLPPWRADVGVVTAPFDWQVPVSVSILTAALLVLSPRGIRAPAGVVGGAFAVLAAPAAIAWPWWVTSAVELPVAVALLLVGSARISLIGRGSGSTDGSPASNGGGSGAGGGGTTGALAIVQAGAGAVLASHALVVSLARPAATTAVLATVTLAGLAAAAVAARQPAPDRVHWAIGGSALTVGLLAWPASLAVGLFAAGVVPWWQARAAFAAAALLLPVLVVTRRWWPGYLPYAEFALGAAVLVTGLAADLPIVDEPTEIYASAGALILSGALLVRLSRAAQPGSATPSGTTGWSDSMASPVGSIRTAEASLVIPGGILLLRSAMAVLLAVVAVLIGPYFWLDAIWTGAPDGVGLTPDGERVGGWSAAITLVVLTGVAALVGWGWRGSIRAAALAAAPVGAVALLAGLVAVRAPWPILPAVSLTVGLVCLLIAALAPDCSMARPAPLARSAPAVGSAPTVRSTPMVRPLATVRFAVVGVPLGVVSAGSGLAGALPTKASTLVALGLIAAAAAAAGAAGRTFGARLAGWLVTVVAGLCFALAGSLAADLPLRVAALAVLGVAAAALALAVALRRPRRAESVAVEAASHTGAVLALLLAAHNIRYAAAVCTLWGVVVGVRALVPGESARRRWILSGVAAASELLAMWLLLAAERVAVLEAYTLPAAGLALVAGWLALRARPELSSWVTYAPGLAAALLPTLASVLLIGQPWRRLLLGVGALAVVLAGAVWRRQAPVLLGGVTLVVIALNEIVRAWDRWPRWIFLAVGGLVLIGVAMTYERRRRDVIRLRDVVGRMR